MIMDDKGRCKIAGLPYGALTSGYYAFLTGRRGDCDLDKQRSPIDEMLNRAFEIFSAAETAGNWAVAEIGYNRPFSFLPGLTVSYELYTSGPEQPYDGQYAHLNEELLGARVDRHPAMTNEQWFRVLDELFLRIVIRENDKPVFIIQGKRCLQNSLYIEGPWEEQLLSWYHANDGVLR